MAQFTWEILSSHGRWFFQRLRELGKDFIFVTNNTSRRVCIGLKIKRDGYIFTRNRFYFWRSHSLLLKAELPEKQVYLVGTPDLEEEFAADGFKLTTNHPSAVVFSFDQTLTYEKLRVACTLIRQGVPFIATHPDLNCPTPQGPIPDCGAMIAAVTAATNGNQRLLVNLIQRWWRLYAKSITWTEKALP